MAEANRIAKPVAGTIRGPRFVRRGSMVRGSCGIGLTNDRALEARFVYHASKCRASKCRASRFMQLGRTHRETRGSDLAPEKATPRLP